jgi:hypothetical protein
MEGTMRIVRTTLAVLATLILHACSEADVYTPLPPDKASYAGEWTAPGISLVIESKGRVIYERKEGTASKSIDSPIKEFKGNNFILGFAFVTTEFVVSEPPHAVGGDWKMTVDGIELTRTPGSPH